VVQATPAHHALTTGHERLDGDTIAGRDVRYAIANLDYLAHQLVAQHLAGDARQDLRHTPGHDVDIAAADAGNRGPDQDLPRARFWRWNFPDFEQARLNEDSSTHRELLPGYSR
jgi:hypothetical protein